MASTAVHRRRLRRVPTALVVIGAVAALAAAITGAAVPLPALGFVSPGHWVYSTILRAAVHVDGATGSIDASVPVNAAADSQVVQGESSGYVVDSGKVTVFGKSDLNVDGTIAAPAGEVPLAIEGEGGPYLVYRHSGKVTRLGDQPVAIPVGGPLTDPVLTADGTMWLLRKDNGRVCELLPGASTVSTCPAQAPAGHQGALSLLSGKPNYVDTTQGTLYSLGENGFGPAIGLGGPTGPHLKAADTDVSGRLALLDPDTHTLRLVDPNAPSAAPVVVHLPEKGEFDGPTAGGSIVAVVDRSTNTVLTYDGQGKERDHEVMPKEAGKPRLTKGDDNRVYVEGDKGTHVMVVGDDGAVDDVPLDHAPDRPSTQDPGKKLGVPEKPDVPVETPDPPDRDVRSQEPPPTHEQHAPPATERHEPPPSHEPPVVSASPPGAPGGVSATAGSASATVRWSGASANGAAVTGYHVTWRSSVGGGSRDVDGGSRSVTVSGLRNGVRYTFSVTAQNDAGRGAAASASVTPVGAASAPQVSALYDGEEGTALVSWKQPALGGGTLVHYTIDATGMAQRTSTGTSMLYTDLPHNGQAVTFTVRAMTSSGGKTVTGAAGSYTWPGDHGSATNITITRGPKNCPDHPDEPTCAQMHVVMTGFAPNTRYAITPHSSNDGYDAGDDHETTDSSGSVTFDTFQYYGVGDEVWVTARYDGNTIESNHMTWTAS
ncbi:fibronectin type III domain protein [Labedaea rhizosphaerae]|uniref:Fibronectin type III domain protein n=1 Tax=Labedaea rhizosphaerae TaxID=598644 RepID=A0A4R6SIY0_LABRH|nr:fibronectin type III domain protein [Labedaea rhizosphaerae]